MAEGRLPGLPAEVPGELREELARLQGQLRVLLRNHQVLAGRLERQPEDPVILKQLGEVKRYLIVFSNQQNVVLGRVRTLLSNLAEERSSRPQPLGPPATPTKPPKARKKATHRKSRDSTVPSLRPSRSASPDSDSVDSGLGLAYLTPGPSQCRGHVEEYTVECPPPETAPEEEEAEEEMEPGPGEPQDDFLLTLALVTVEASGRRLARVARRRSCRATLGSSLPQIEDKKIRQQAFLQSCLTSPPHLRRRPGAAHPAHRAATGSRGQAGPSPGLLESRMGTRSKSPSVATLVQLDGALDLPEEEEETWTGDEEQARGRVAVRDGLLKRRVELGQELDGLRARQEELTQRREVQRETRALMLRQQRETEGRIRGLLTLLRDPQLVQTQ